MEVKTKSESDYYKKVAYNQSLEISAINRKYQHKRKQLSRARLALTVLFLIVIAGALYIGL